MSADCPRAAVVVVAYNSAADLPACLEAVVGRDDIAEVVVVDNCSPDDSARVAEAAAARVLRAEANRGFGAGCNLGVAATTTDAVMLLNPDAVAGPGTVGGLVAYLAAHPRVGAVASDLRYADGTLQPGRRRFPSVVRTPLEPGLAARLDERAYQRRAPAGGPVDWVVGAAVLLRRSAFDEVGGFDERYFLYAEELDLCARLKAAGWEVHWVPGHPTVHHSGTATRSLPGAGKVAWVDGFLRAARTHHRRPGAIRAGIVVGFGGRALVWLLLARPARARAWATAARAALAS